MRGLAGRLQYAGIALQQHDGERSVQQQQIWRASRDRFGDSGSFDVTRSQSELLLVRGADLIAGWPGMWRVQLRSAGIRSPSLGMPADRPRCGISARLLPQGAIPRRQTLLEQRQIG